jgi:hypothetical protein
MEVTRERIIADTGLFVDLDPAEQAEVAALMRPFELGSEEVLFREGEIADRLYLVANEGWKLLPLYRFDPFSGQWHHRDGRSRPAVGLYDVHYDTGEMEFRGQAATAPETELVHQLEEAKRTIERFEREADEEDAIIDLQLGTEFERLRWFPLPGEALRELRAATPAR